jgi:hypothetical protein
MVGLLIFSYTACAVHEISWGCSVAYYFLSIERFNFFGDTEKTHGPVGEHQRGVRTSVPFINEVLPSLVYDARGRSRTTLDPLWWNPALRA